MADLLENLNERQREAVLETEGYVRVIAGAGSGKTKLLVSRYAYLVQDYGIESSNILCVTFTNKAAGEMKRRIRGLLGDENDLSLICTYHGFCNRLLRENPEKLFLNKQFQIMDAYEQKAVLSEIYQKFDLKLDYATFEAILRKIGYAKRDMKYVVRICNPRPCRILEKIQDQDDRIIEEFLQRQKATYSLDFHDLIAFAIYLLETDAQIRKKWQERLNYIMVDEFQDSSSVEMRLVEVLSGLYRNLMIVGDPDQNIYEWRGSDVKLLVDFDKTHEPTKTIILNQNYRSTPQILQCANTLIEKNQLRLKKELFTRNPPGANVVHYHSKDDYEEMEQIIRNIKQLRETEGLCYSDFAVIYRAGFLSRVAEKKLVEKNIPYEIFGGVRFYQRMEILDILAYLKLIAFDDDMSFKRVVNKPRRRFGRAKMNLLESLTEQAKQDYRERSGREADGERENEISLFSVLSRNLGEDELLNSDVGSFVQFVQAMRREYREKRISDIVNEVTRDSGYEAYIRELGDEERLDNLSEFKRIANEFEREFGENLSLEGFLQQIALQSGEDRGEDRDTVKLMTIHSSKGLEFPVVFILGFTEGLFPSAKTIGDRKKLGLEEERRLCYVAITRAEKHLFLMESEGTSPNGMKKLVSRFLEEIGEHNYVRIGRISEDLKRESKAYAAKLNLELQGEPAENRKVGDEVEHHVFGKGIIMGIDRKRNSYSVKFEKMPLPRNISHSYFEKEHVDLRQESRKGAEENSRAEKGTETDAAGSETEQVMDGTEDKEEDARAGEPSAGSEAEQVSDGTEAEKEGADVGRRAGEPSAGSEAEQVSDRTEDAGNLEKAPPNLSLEQCPPDWKAAETLRQNQERAQEEVRERGQERAREEVQEENREDAPERAPEEVQEENREEAWEDAQEEAREETWERAQEETREKVRQQEKERIRQLKADSPNLWKREDVPHSGWNCVGVEDLGGPVGICQMCGYQIIRYAHQMEHPKYRSLSVGCVCAGRMEGDVAEAKRREADFKNRQSRRVNFFKRKWKRSRKGYEYLKIDDHIIVLLESFKASRDGKRESFWKFSIDNLIYETAYATRERAVAAAFDALEQKRS